MPVRLTSDLHSPEGQAFFDRLSALEDDIAFHCGCPAGVSCTVVLVEARNGGYDVIVTRRGTAAAPPPEWIAIERRSATRYVRSFQSPTPVEVAESVSRLIAAPLSAI